VRDFCAVDGSPTITRAAADKALGRLEVDARGLDAMDRRYLNCIATTFDGGPVGVETLAAARVRGIKVALRNDVGPVLDMATLHAIVRAAEAANLPVAAHVQGDGMLDIALEAGVHELAHTPWTHDLTADQVARVAATVVTTPTLDIHSDNPDDLRRAISNTAALKRAGGRFRYGTDIGNGVPAQVNQSEAKWMVEAGFTVDEILVAMACPVKLGSPLGVVAFKGDPFDELDHLGRIAFGAIG
jgi:imidazolonepropionase-like amidohydrolase